MKQKVAVKAVKSVKNVKAPKAPKAVKAVKAVEAVKAPKSVEAVKAPVKAPVKAVKRVKAAKAAKAVKAVKAVKSVKAPARAVKAVRKYRKGGMPNEESVLTLPVENEVSVLTIPSFSTGSVNTRKKLKDLQAPPKWSLSQKTVINATSINPVNGVLHTTALKPSSALELPRIDPNISIKAILDNIYQNKDEKIMDVYSIIMDYRRTYDTTDEYLFKTYAKILLTKLILINKPDSDDIYKYDNIKKGEEDEKVIELRKLSDTATKKIENKKTFLENIFNKFIRHHLYNDNGQIKFKSSLEGKIEKEKAVLRFLDSVKDEIERRKIISLKIAENIENAKIHRAGETARAGRYKGYDADYTPFVKKHRPTVVYDANKLY